MDKKEIFREFEEMGVWQVRLVTPGYNGPRRGFALEWLRLQDQEERRRIEAAQEEQNTTARTAKNAAIIAAIAAIAAVILAIISNVIAVLAWEHPVH